MVESQPPVDIEPALPRSLSRIVLTGFMGSGKTTVGRLLAGRLSLPFLDIDQVIVAETSSSIPELFSLHGEPWFRQLERATIARYFEEKNDPGQKQPLLVMALGGGAIEDPATCELLLGDSATRLIHLEASLPTVLRRCQGTEAERPVLADRDRLAARYHHRLPLYRQAHLSLAVDNLTPEETVQALLASLRNTA